MDDRQVESCLTASSPCTQTNPLEVDALSLFVTKGHLNSRGIQECMSQIN